MNNKPNTSGSGKKFYVSLFCAAALMVIMGVIGMQISPEQTDSGEDFAGTKNQNQGQEIAFGNSQTEENESELPSADEGSKSSDLALNDDSSKNVPLNKGTELEDFSQSPTLGEGDDEDTAAVFSNESQSLDEKKKEEEKKNEKKNNKNKDKNNDSAKETFGVSNLAFPEEDGLLWPVTGDILLNYSMDKGVYFKTLGQYKCNPAVLIKGSEGDEILSSCNGTIQSISEDAETGLTITMSAGDSTAGNHYEVIYGQLDNVKVAEGEMVSAGQVLGTLAKPTKYYISEGTHLYYKVLKDGEPTNPLLLLQ